MTKVALITDQHFGVRNDSKVFLDFQRNFYEHTFFPYLKKHNIKEVVDLGDTFDKRKHINYNTFKEVDDFYFSTMEDMDIQLHILVGNHCTYFKNTNRVNSPDLLLGKYKNIRVYDSPVHIKLGDLMILMMPWICSGNYEECMKAIDNSSADIMMCHAEIAGFQMYRGQINDHGFKPSTFKNFKKVLSGHFHHRSSEGNITYLGAPYEMTWSDFDDERGFHILDTETMKMEYIKTDIHMFHKIIYNDNKEVDNHINFNTLSDSKYDWSRYTDSFVKVVIEEKNDALLFDKFIDKLTEVNVYNYKIVEDHMYMDDSSDDEILEGAEDTLDILIGYVDTLDVDDKTKKMVDKFMRNLYSDALAIT